MGRGKRLCPVPCSNKVVVHLPRSHEYKSLLNKALQKGKMPYAVQLIDRRATGEKLINFETATLECSEESSFEERQEVEMEQFEVLENEEEEIVTDEFCKNPGTANWFALFMVLSLANVFPLFYAPLFMSEYVFAVL